MRGLSKQRESGDFPLLAIQRRVFLANRVEMHSIIVLILAIKRRVVVASRVEMHRSKKWEETCSAEHLYERWLCLKKKPAGPRPPCNPQFISGKVLSVDVPARGRHATPKMSVSSKSKADGSCINFSHNRYLGGRQVCEQVSQPWESELCGL